jgi:hypothetical protein
MAKNVVRKCNEEDVMEENTLSRKYDRRNMIERIQWKSMIEDVIERRNMTEKHLWKCNRNIR